MAEVYVNTNSPVKTKIFYQGEIVDPDGSVSATLYDITEDPFINPLISSTSPVATLSASKIDSDFGSYLINMPNSLTTRNRNFKITWTYSVNGSAITHNTFCDIVTPYANLAEAIEDLGLGTDPSDPKYKTYHELQMAEKYARKIIESYTGQRFYLYNDTAIAYGSGSNLLPLQFKIYGLRILAAEDTVLIDSINNINYWGWNPEIVEGGFALKAIESNALDGTTYVANGMATPTINALQGDPFLNGKRYKIEGAFGYEDVPDNVEQAAIQLMGDYFSKDKLWTNKYIKRIQTFDWQFEYNSDVYKGTGNAYADSLLYPYVLSNMMVI